MSDLSANHLFSVKGLVAVITGGGTGIGLMMTRALALNGAHKVYIIGRRKEKLDEAARINPEVIIPLVGDVTSKESLQAVVSQIKQDAGYVNFLVANSGVMGPSTGVKAGEVSLAEYAKKAFDQSWEGFNSAMEINVTAAYFTAIAFLELLHAGNEKRIFPDYKSSILITTSIAAYNKMPNLSNAYRASKAGAASVARTLSTELIPYSIRVNALAPGVFPSDLATFLYKDAKGDPTKEGSMDKSFVPAERIGSEEDMAGTTLYLASRAGAYANGLQLVLDGGRLNVLPSSY